VIVIDLILINFILNNTVMFFVILAGPCRSLTTPMLVTVSYCGSPFYSIKNVRIMKYLMIIRFCHGVSVNSSYVKSEVKSGIESK